MSSLRMLPRLSSPSCLLSDEKKFHKSTPLYLLHKDDEEQLYNLCGDDWPYLNAGKKPVQNETIFLLPGKKGIRGAIAFYEDSGNPECFGALFDKLPSLVWSIQSDDEVLLENAFLGICLDAYRFSLSCQKVKSKGPCFLVPSSFPRSKLKRVEIIAKAIWMGRDLINMPANILGPQELAHFGAEELKKRGASVKIITDKKLEEDYPCLAAVASGSDRGGAVLSAHWSGKKGAPHIALVGKGVCFDTGGYDLKPGSSMSKMKKDMGGAALILGLACALIETGQELEIDVRLGCVENSISGHALRPGDVVKTRQGLSVEIGNTDAEGRLVLCDLLAEVGEKKPDLILDVSTLTGAARVALGPDLPALFCNNDEIAEKLLKAGRESSDPLWRLPLWSAYDAWLESKIADCNNISSKPMAGAITAALYLQRFVREEQNWAHIDSYAWNDQSRPCHPEGGEMLTMRALFRLFSTDFSLQS